MKKDRYIQENEHIIKDFSASFGLNKKMPKEEHPLVIQEDDERFLIVKEFSEDAKAGIVTSFNRLDKSKLEKDETGKTIVYAEEIFDSEEELYSNEVHDTLIKKEKHRSYVDIGNAIDENLVKYGYRGEIGYKLLCSMKFSRFINVQDHEDLATEFSALAKSIGSKSFSIPFYDKAESIVSDGLIFDYFSYAKENPNRPVFIVVSNIPSNAVMPYLRPVYNYIDNPNGDNYITSSGKIMYIPHNVWFVYSLSNGTMYSNISRRILRYSTDLYYELSKVSTEGVTQVPSHISLEELNMSFREASETYSINDESWKQIDQFVESIRPVSGYSLQNKIARSLEDYMIALKVSGMTDENILDQTLANNFIKEAIICTKPELYQSEYLLSEILDNCFGEDKLPLTREKALWYVDQFDKGGNLKNAK